MDSSDKWIILNSQELLATNFFKLRSDRCQVPDGRIVSNYYVIEVSDWVNIIPVTSEGEVILVEQYRHGNQQICLEVPGGVIDSHKGETAAEAALRELREETGYTTSKLEFLGKHQPNPAIQQNWMHTYLALDCKPFGKQQLDQFERIQVIKKPLHEVLDLVYEGKINHSIIMGSLFLALRSLGISVK